jgi:8-amino-7-oxononanoate synthase
MMPSSNLTGLEPELERRLAALRKEGLYRELRRVDSAQSPCIQIRGRTLLNFSSNDYLGLANEPAVKEAAVEAVWRYGAGAGASRLICGSLAPHQQLDEAIAGFKGTEAALSFATGYAAALGAIGALVGKEDVLIVDKWVHACIVDAARLCGAKLRVFAHNDLNDLEAILKWAARRNQQPSRAAQRAAPRTLIVTESVFSMDGDRAPLRAIADLKDQYGAWLMVDEAHATGMHGANRRGMAEALGVSHRIEIQMGTLGKALGASGGYLCGSHRLVEYLINRARPLIFSTAPVPAAVAAATAGIHFVQSSAGEERCRLLWQRVSELASSLPSLSAAFPGSEPATAPALVSQIVPLIVGDETRAMEAAAALREQGIFIPAVRYPTVARGRARLRVTVSAVHTREQVQQLAKALTALNLGSHAPQPGAQADAPSR